MSGRPTGAGGKRTASRFVLCRGSRHILTRGLARPRYKTIERLCWASSRHEEFVEAFDGGKPRIAKLSLADGQIVVGHLRTRGGVGLFYDEDSFYDAQESDWDFGSSMRSACSFGNLVAVAIGKDMSDEALARELGLPLVRDALPKLRTITDLIWNVSSPPRLIKGQE